jgi:HEAT repeat protein
MGADAFPCMLKGLTNRHELVRSEAMNFLGQSEDAEIKSRRKEAVPLILKLLEDTNETVRMNATNTFVEIDPEAARKAGVKISNDK